VISSRRCDENVLLKTLTVILAQRTRSPIFQGSHQEAVGQPGRRNGQAAAAHHCFGKYPTGRWSTQNYGWTRSQCPDLGVAIPLIRHVMGFPSDSLYTPQIFVDFSLFFSLAFPPLFSAFFRFCENQPRGSFYLIRRRQFLLKAPHAPLISTMDDRDHRLHHDSLVFPVFLGSLGK